MHQRVDKIKISIEKDQFVATYGDSATAHGGNISAAIGNLLSQIIGPALLGQMEVTDTSTSERSPRWQVVGPSDAGFSSHETREAALGGYFLMVGACEDTDIFGIADTVILPDGKSLELKYMDDNDREALDDLLNLTDDEQLALYKSSYGTPRNKLQTP